MKIYIVGIGGAGTSALANVFHKRGDEVLGSDVGDGFYTKKLKENGIVVYDDFEEEHIDDDIDFVVYSTAIEDNNVEIVQASKRKIDTITYPEALGRLTRNMCAICVCGTHGKTTTTALTGFAFIEAQVKPTVIVGSRVVGWGTGSRVLGDDLLIMEADEYQDKLALYDPCQIILTSVDFDHPDYFSDIGVYKDTFVRFINRMPSSGYLVACGDDENVRDITAQSIVRNIIHYGTSEGNDFQIIKRMVDEGGQRIYVRKINGEEFDFYIKLHGEHNAKNALAALIMASGATDQRQQVIKGLEKCRGTARRFERVGKLNGAILVDDYAHHPEELRATLSAAREVFSSKRLIVAFHPHTFTRTEALLDDFVDALSIADRIVVLDIYGSAREKKGNVSAEDIAAQVNDMTNEKAVYMPKIKDLAQWMKKELREGDVFFTCGAGDIWRVYEALEDEITKTADKK